MVQISADPMQDKEQKNQNSTHTRQIKVSYLKK